MTKKLPTAPPCGCGRGRGQSARGLTAPSIQQEGGEAGPVAVVVGKQGEIQQVSLLLEAPQGEERVVEAAAVGEDDFHPDECVAVLPEGQAQAALHHAAVVAEFLPDEPPVFPWEGEPGDAAPPPSWLVAASKL